MTPTQKENLRQALMRVPTDMLMREMQRRAKETEIDLEAIGKYIATANPYVIYARAVEVLEATEYNKTVAEYREQGKYYGNELF